VGVGAIVRRTATIILKAYTNNYVSVSSSQKLFVSLFVTIFSQSFFTLMRGNLMTLSFFTTRHYLINFLLFK